MANTIQDKLTYLSGTKDAIKQAIIAKGVEVTDTDTFRSYANKIEAIQSGGSGTVNLPNGTKFSNSTFTTINDSIISFPMLFSLPTIKQLVKGNSSTKTLLTFKTLSK